MRRCSGSAAISTSSPDPRHYHHHSIALGLKIGAENRAWAAEALRGQFDQAAAAGCHTCIVSSELFTENPDLALIRGLLAGHSVQIVAYLRRPDELLASAYSEMVRDAKMRWTRGLGERPYAYDPSHWAMLVDWLAVFGPDELTLAPFDAAQWPRHDLVRDFLCMIGLTEIIPLERDLSDADANVGLPASLLEVLRMANASVPMSPETHALFVHCLYELRLQYPELYANEASLMEPRQRRECFRALAKRLPSYRPYYRPDFDERFLHWRRPSLRTRIGKALLRR